MTRLRSEHECNSESPTGRSSAAILLLAIAGLLVACGGGGGGGTATLTWDASVDPRVSGYRIYYGTAPGLYFQPFREGLDVGNITTYTVTGLNRATTYYFSATAYDALNNESGFSNEAYTAIP